MKTSPRYEIIRESSVDDIYKVFSADLRKAREKKKIGRTRLATCSGVSHIALYNIESALSKPSFNTILKFASLLDMDLNKYVKLVEFMK